MTDPTPEPRETNRQGGAAVALLFVMGVGILALLCGFLEAARVFPSAEGWAWWLGGLAILILCGAISVIVFRLTSPSRRRRK